MSKNCQHEGLKLSDLKSDARKLVELLEKPERGLLTWNQSLRGVLVNIKDKIEKAGI